MRDLPVTMTYFVMAAFIPALKSSSVCIRATINPDRTLKLGGSMTRIEDRGKSQ